MSDGPARLPFDDRFHDIVLRLDATTELSRGVRRSNPMRRDPEPRQATDIVRATGMAAAELADLHIMLGNLYAAGLDQAAVTAWRTAVQYLQAASENLAKVTGFR
jgi:hypothetical protein